MSADLLATPWLISASAWQSLKGVHQPWIAEIAPSQYAGLSKRGKAQYDVKRSAEWQASADCKAEYRAAVLAAFDRGEIDRKTPGIHRDASDAILWAQIDREKATQKEREAAALEANRYTSLDELEIGATVFAIGFGQYGTVEKKNKKTTRVAFVTTWKNFSHNCDPRELQRLSYQDCVNQVRTSSSSN